MLPLVFLPGQAAPHQSYLQGLPVCYDLRSTDQQSRGVMTVSISERRAVGEPLYCVTVTTVKVEREQTVRYLWLGGGFE